MNILIAAGGTGGHITPGIAIANALRDDGNEVLFVGTKKGMEVDLVPKAGYDIKFIHAKAKIEAGIELLKGIKDVRRIIRENKIDLVIGTGGYVTAPAIIAGLKEHIPTMIHESNALPGKTTKLLASKVDVVALGFKEAITKLPNAKNAVFTGNPTKIKNDLNMKDWEND